MSTTTARRSRAAAHAWMREGICLDYRDLPWIADPEQTTAWERTVMGALCQDCPVRTDCAGHATAEKVTAGFWAGQHRDPDTAAVMTGPGWAIDPLPGLDGLGGAA
jgi:Transcription factor WhiB